MRRLTHINGRPFSTLWPGNVMESAIKFIDYDSVCQPKDSLTDIPGADGAIQADPQRDVRKITIRGLVGGDPHTDDEPLRVLRRIFRLGLDASDAITLGFTENNFPGDGPHWTIAAMVTDELAFTQEQPALWRWQVILTAAQPDYLGRSFAYTLEEGREAVGHAFDFDFDYTYGSIVYESALTVFLEGSVASPLSAVIRGVCTNPKILNVTTGEYLKLNVTLGEDDEIEVAENGVVKLNGQYKNSLREVGTAMPKLWPGTNTLVFLDDTDPFVDGNYAELDIAYITRDA